MYGLKSWFLVETGVFGMFCGGFDAELSITFLVIFDVFGVFGFFCFLMFFGVFVSVFRVFSVFFVFFRVQFCAGLTIFTL